MTCQSCAPYDFVPGANFCQREEGHQGPHRAELWQWEFVYEWTDDEAATCGAPIPTIDYPTSQQVYCQLQPHATGDHIGQDKQMSGDALYRWPHDEPRMRPVGI